MTVYYNSNGKVIDISSMRRCGRDRLLEATQDGYLDPQTVVEMMARWMTSDEIYEMCDLNDVNLARLCND